MCTWVNAKNKEEYQFDEESKAEARQHGAMTVEEWDDTIAAYGWEDEHMCPNDPWAWRIRMALVELESRR